MGDDRPTDWPPEWLLVPPFPNEERLPPMRGGGSMRWYMLKDARKEYKAHRERQAGQPPPSTVKAAAALLMAELSGASIGLMGAMTEDELLDESVGVGVWVRNRVVWGNPAFPAESIEVGRQISAAILRSVQAVARRQDADDVSRDEWAVNALRQNRWEAARQSAALDDGPLPKTVSAAVEWLMARVPDATLAKLGGLYREELHETHFGLALQIRNALLWSNPELVKATGAIEADGASAVIVERLWEAVHADPRLQEAVAAARRERDRHRNAVAEAAAAEAVRRQQLAARDKEEAETIVALWRAGDTMAESRLLGWVATRVADGWWPRAAWGETAGGCVASGSMPWVFDVMETQVEKWEASTEPDRGNYLDSARRDAAPTRARLRAFAEAQFDKSQAPLRWTMVLLEENAAWGIILRSGRDPAPVAVVGIVPSPEAGKDLLRSRGYALHPDELVPPLTPAEQAAVVPFREYSKASEDVVEAALALAVTHGVAVPDDLIEAMQRFLSNRGSDGYAPLVTPYELEMALTPDEDDEEDDDDQEDGAATASELDRAQANLERAFDEALEEGEHVHFMLYELSGPGGATAWMVGFMGHAGEHSFAGPFATADEADAAILAVGYSSPDDVHEDPFAQG